MELLGRISSDRSRANERRFLVEPQENRRAWCVRRAFQTLSDLDFVPFQLIADRVGKPRQHRSWNYYHFRVRR